MICIKIINSYRTVVAIADSELIGKKFEEGRFQLDVKENFYKGEKEYSEEDALNLIRDMKKEDATFNIVGEKAVNLAIKAGIIETESFGKIQGVPFTLVLL
ncbi:Uncharacterised protein [uncultured archaeon]|nr:Uncharacterised protein [uncultured archaeon]